MTAEAIESLTKFAWPLVAIVALFLFKPALLKALERREVKLKGGDFSLEIGDKEIPIQEAANQQRALIEDLQDRLIDLSQRTESLESNLGDVVEKARSQKAVSSHRGIEPTIPPRRRILWVDDYPSNNAYPVAKLEKEENLVTQVVSTDQAMQVLSSGVSFDAIITDMGREGEGPDAGLDLIRRVREAGLSTPIFVYTSSASLFRTATLAREAGGNGSTSSAVELFEFLGAIR